MTLADVHALDRYLVDRKYLGDAERLAGLALGRLRAGSRERAAAHAAGRGGSRRGTEPRRPARRPHRRRSTASSRSSRRAKSARGAATSRGSPAISGPARPCSSALQMLRDAHAAHDPAPLSIARAVRRGAALDRRADLLAAPRRRRRDAARRRAPRRTRIVDELRIVGLSEADWPERSARSIFYPQSLLAQLGWPGEQDRLPAAARALPGSAAPAAPARLALDVHARGRRDRVAVAAHRGRRRRRACQSNGLTVRARDGAGVARVRSRSAGDAIRSCPGRAVRGEAAEWLALRIVAPLRRAAVPRRRPVRAPPSTYAVSRLERYLECPFKYYAAHVLKLPEERDEQAWMTPQERGHFVHEVFESFFLEWQRLGHGAITTANVAEAIALFDTVAEAAPRRSCPKGIARSSARCSSDRRRRPGSASAPSRSRSRTAFPSSSGCSSTSSRARLHVRGGRRDAAGDAALEGGSDRPARRTARSASSTTRSAARPRRSARCSCRSTASAPSRRSTGGTAGPGRSRAPATSRSRRSPRSSSCRTRRRRVAEGQETLLAVIDAIERGEFPVQPDEPFLCNWCAYPGRVPQGLRRRRS